MDRQRGPALGRGVPHRHREVRQQVRHPRQRRRHPGRPSGAPPGQRQAEGGGEVGLGRARRGAPVGLGHGFFFGWGLVGGPTKQRSQNSINTGIGLGLRFSCEQVSPSRYRCHVGLYRGLREPNEPPNRVETAGEPDARRRLCEAVVSDYPNSCGWACQKAS